MAIKQPVRKKLYRTMQGRMVDIDKLRAANENVQAVGNMGVNARGDVIGQGGRIIKTKDSVMKDYYQTPKGVAQDTPIKREQPQPKVQPQVMNPTEKPIDEKPVKTVRTFKPKSEPKIETSTETKSGIDAALDGIE
jgi:outer membrane biosynthesis protein TonB